MDLIIYPHDFAWFVTCLSFTLLAYVIGEKFGFMNGWKARIKYEQKNRLK